MTGELDMIETYTSSLFELFAEALPRKTANYENNREDLRRV